MKQNAYTSIRDAYMYRHVPECMRVLADFYWRLLLFVALGVLALSLVYGVTKLSYVIAENDRTFSQSVNATQQAPKLDKTQLQATIKAFREREERFNSLKTVPQKISDPSR